MNKEEVIEVTLKLLKEKKLEKTSIGEIVKRLGSSPGNIYYHFKNKNDIYKEAVDYSCKEILKALNGLETPQNKEESLHQLTKELIRFLEKREEILFFLMNIRGSYYLDKDLDCKDFMFIFRNLLIQKKIDLENEKQLMLKIRMFLGSIYEVLYVNKVENKEELKEEEIDGICNFYWGTSKKYNHTIGN